MTGGFKSLSLILIISFGLNFEGVMFVPYEYAIYKNNVELCHMTSMNGFLDTWKNISYNKMLRAYKDDYFNIKARVGSGTGRTFDIHCDYFAMTKIRGLP